MIVRVGIPHRGGRLAFHAFQRGYPAMVSANAFWNGRAFVLPEASDIEELDLALDSAGFTAMNLWKLKGRQPGIGGVFPWTYAQYIEFALLLNPAWWAQPDLCCEPEIARNQAEIDYRVNATATFLEGTMRIVRQWGEWPSPVPVIQGRSAGDYLRSLELTLAVWERWHSSPPPLIGIGSVCRRPARSLVAIVNALETHLPASSRLHLFGVKGNALSLLKMFNSIASVDSMAYDFGARLKACKQAKPNDLAHRSAEMSQWMDAATARIIPSIGDQFRLQLSI